MYSYIVSDPHCLLYYGPLLFLLGMSVVRLLVTYRVENCSQSPKHSGPNLEHPKITYLKLENGGRIFQFRFRFGVLFSHS